MIPAPQDHGRPASLSRRKKVKVICIRMKQNKSEDYTRQRFSIQV